LVRPVVAGTISFGRLRRSGARHGGSRRLRIAYVSADFGVPFLGRKGASVHVRRLTSALAGRGHEVLVLTPVRGEGAAEPAGCRVFEIPFSRELAGVYELLKHEQIGRDTRLPKDVRNLLYSLWLENRAALLLDGLRPDLVYERYSLMGTAGLRLAERFGAPHILEVNAPLVEEQQEQRGLSLPAVARHLQDMVFTGADEIVVVSQWLAEYVAAAGADPKRVTVLPNAADTELFRPGSARGELRRRLGWDDRFVVGFVGTMKNWHGVPTLLDALKHLGAPRSRFRLLLVGDGPELSGLKERVAVEGLTEAVFLAGEVAHDSVPQWLEAMDVAVVPYAPTAASYFSPIKLFECMSMGRPVVAASLGQVAQIIEEGRTGWLYPPGNDERLAERIDWLARNHDAAANAGAAARAHVLAHHTWARNAEAVEEIAGRAMRRRAAVGPIMGKGD
jgi:glycosyltransferase involved in cell wall biosynthesis